MAATKGAKGFVVSAFLGLGVLGNPGTAQAQRLGGFVKTQGTHFEVDGQPFFFQGANLYRAGIVDRQSDAQIYDAFRQYAEKGLKVVRFWGFSCDPAYGRLPMIRDFSVSGPTYNEGALERLDTALDAARSAGLRVILPLVNFEREYCSMEFWAQKLTGQSDRQAFYTDDTVRNAFKEHVRQILGRVNTVYAQRYGERRTYSEDPTIMAIELANEPHTDDNYERSRGMRSGELVYQWLRDMASHVRRYAPNHLISTGEEGYKVNPRTEGEKQANTWLSNGWKGVDFERNLDLPTIDFATIHLFLDNWQIPASQMDWIGDNFLKDRAELARARNKPIILEEAGFSRSSRRAWLGYTANPEIWLDKIYQYANEAGYAGTMVWQLSPVGVEEGDYDYDFAHPLAPVVFRQATYMNGLTVSAMP